MNNLAWVRHIYSLIFKFVSKGVNRLVIKLEELLNETTALKESIDEVRASL